MNHLDPVDIPNAAPSSAKAQDQDQNKDPVCGMDVNPATARYKTLHNGKEYFFCSAGCLAKFQATPEKILSSPPTPMGSGLVSLGTPNRTMPTAVGTGTVGTGRHRTGQDARRSLAQLAGGCEDETRTDACVEC